LSSVIENEIEKEIWVILIFIKLMLETIIFYKISFNPGILFNSQAKLKQASKTKGAKANNFNS
jgi:hypothetical protein